MTTKYTPGPWKATRFADGTIGIHARIKGQPVEVAVLRRDTAGPTANARLIAAAPDLLEALIACEGYLAFDVNAGGGDRDILERVRSAIAKARGEG